MKANRLILFIFLIILTTMPSYSQMTRTDTWDDGLYYPTQNYYSMGYKNSTTEKSKTDAELESTIQQDPSDFDAYIELSRRFRTKRMFEKSEDLLNKALRLGNDTALVYQEMGILKSWQRKDSIARDWFEKATKYFPSNPTCWISLAGSWRQENPTKAMEYYEKALTLPDCPNYAYIVLANMYKQTGQTKKIEILLNQVLKIKPLTAQEYYTGGSLYEILNQNEKAIEYLQKCIMEDTEQGSVRYSAINRLTNLMDEKSLFAYFKKEITSYQFYIK